MLCKQVLTKAVLLTMQALSVAVRKGCYHEKLVESVLGLCIFFRRAMMLLVSNCFQRGRRVAISLAIYILD
jgi:hypothetical protein